MKLAELKNIVSLDFDLLNRQLTVFHTNDHDIIFTYLDSLHFDTTFIETKHTDISISSHENKEKQSLYIVLAINAILFIIELISGFISNSMGLIADSFDMLADSIVYSLALFAIGGTLLRKKNIAKAAGYLQLILAIWGFIEVLRRFIGIESLPSFQTMIGISILAFIGNAICLYVLQKSKSKEAHMQASMIFTSNDIIVNLGVILAGVFVYITHSQYPDLIIGIIVFILVVKGAFNIFKLSK
jgi:Co/Zn/Cd efflux system component